MDLLLLLIFFHILINFLNVAASSSSDDNAITLKVTTASLRADQEELTSNMDDGYRDLVFLDTFLHNLLYLLSFLSPKLNGRILKELGTSLLKLIMVKILEHLL